MIYKFNPHLAKISNPQFYSLHLSSPVWLKFPHGETSRRVGHNFGKEQQFLLATRCIVQINGPQLYRLFNLKLKQLGKRKSSSCPTGEVKSVLLALRQNAPCLFSKMFLLPALLVLVEVEHRVPHFPGGQHILFEALVKHGEHQVEFLALGYPQLENQLFQLVLVLFEHPQPLHLLGQLADLLLLLLALLLQLLVLLPQLINFILGSKEGVLANLEGALLQALVQEGTFIQLVGEGGVGLPDVFHYLYQLFRHLLDLKLLFLQLHLEIQLALLQVEILLGQLLDPVMEFLHHEVPLLHCFLHLGLLPLPDVHLLHLVHDLLVLLLVDLAELLGLFQLADLGLQVAYPLHVVQLLLLVHLALLDDPELQPVNVLLQVLHVLALIEAAVHARLLGGQIEFGFVDGVLVLFHLGQQIGVGLAQPLDFLLHGALLFVELRDEFLEEVGLVLRLSKPVALQGLLDDIDEDLLRGLLEHHDGLDELFLHRGLHQQHHESLEVLDQLPQLLLLGDCDQVDATRVEALLVHLLEVLLDLEQDALQVLQLVRPSDGRLVHPQVEVVLGGGDLQQEAGEGHPADHAGQGHLGVVAVDELHDGQQLGIHLLPIFHGMLYYSAGIYQFIQQYYTECRSHDGRVPVVVQVALDDREHVHAHLPVELLDALLAGGARLRPLLLALHLEVWVVVPVVLLEVHLDVLVVGHLGLGALGGEEEALQPGGDPDAAAQVDEAGEDEGDDGQVVVGLGVLALLEGLAVADGHEHDDEVGDGHHEGEQPEDLLHAGRQVEVELVGDDVAAQDEVLVLPVEDQQGEQADEQGRRVDEAHARTEEHEPVDVGVLVGQVDLHVLVVEVGLGLGHGDGLLLDLVALVVLVALPVVEADQEEGDERVGDEQEEDVEEVLLEVEGEAVEGPALLVDQVVVDQVAEEGGHQHVDQVQHHQLRGHRVVVRRLGGVHLRLVLGHPDHPRHNGVEQGDQLRVYERQDQVRTVYRLLLLYELLLYCQQHEVQPDQQGQRQGDQEAVCPSFHLVRPDVREDDLRRFGGVQDHDRAARPAQALANLVPQSLQEVQVPGLLSQGLLGLLAVQGHDALPREAELEALGPAVPLGDGLVGLGTGLELWVDWLLVGDPLNEQLEHLLVVVDFDFDQLLLVLQLADLLESILLIPVELGPLGKGLITIQVIDPPPQVLMFLLLDNELLQHSPFIRVQRVVGLQVVDEVDLVDAQVTAPVLAHLVAEELVDLGDGDVLGQPLDHHTVVGHLGQDVVLVVVVLVLPGHLDVHQGHQHNRHADGHKVEHPLHLQHINFGHIHNINDGGLADEPVEGVDEPIEHHTHVALMQVDHQRGQAADEQVHSDQHHALLDEQQVQGVRAADVQQVAQVAAQGQGGLVDGLQAAGAAFHVLLGRDVLAHPLGEPVLGGEVEVGRVGRGVVVAEHRLPPRCLELRDGLQQGQLACTHYYLSYYPIIIIILIRLKHVQCAYSPCYNNKLIISLPAMLQNKPSHQYKVVVVGDANVGKTHLTLKLCGMELPNDGSTVGIDITKFKTLNEEGDHIVLNFWDTAGQEQYRSIVKTFLKGIHAVLIVYSVAQDHSRAALAHWLKEVDEGAKGNSVVVAIVGNKLDLLPGCRSGGDQIHRLKQKYRQHQVREFLVSAKTGQNVKQMRDWLVEVLGRQSRERNPLGDRPIYLSVAASSFMNEQQRLLPKRSLCC